MTIFENNQFNEALKQELLKGYPERDELYFEYTESFEKSGLLKMRIDRDIDEYKNFDRFIYYCDLLALYSIYRGAYSSVVLDDFSQTKEMFAYASHYSYMAIHITSMLCYVDYDYTNEGKPFIDMFRISPLWGSVFIANDWNAIGKIGNDLIDSLNAKACIIKRGNRCAYISWFMVKLYALATKKDINQRIVAYPIDGFDLYEEVLKKWNTIDVNELDKIISMLCELHTLQPEHRFFPSDGGEYFEQPYLQIFPYEALVLLKLRKKNGIFNPDSFSHALMQTSLMTELLKSDEIMGLSSLPPYSKTLLKYLEAAYPKLQSFEGYKTKISL